MARCATAITFELGQCASPPTAHQKVTACGGTWHNQPPHQHGCWDRVVLKTCSNTLQSVLVVLRHMKTCVLYLLPHVPRQMSKPSTSPCVHTPPPAQNSTAGLQVNKKQGCVEQTLADATAEDDYLQFRKSQNYDYQIPHPQTPHP